MALSLCSFAMGNYPNIRTELADYASAVDPYFHQGRQTHTVILKDITTCRKQWPWRTLHLVAIEAARRDDLNTLKAT